MKKIFLFLSILFMILLFSNISAQKEKKRSFNTLRKAATFNSFTKLNMNNISTYIYNDGLTDMVSSGSDGFNYPKGSKNYAFFSSGLIWGGYLGSYWTVGGSDYKSGLQPGRILPDGTPENQTLPHVRIYRVRSDFKNFKTNIEKAALFASEINDEGKTVDEIYQQYLKDWNEWPAVYGAPFIDKNNDGVYDPNIDVPGVSEQPCQTVWYVANDMNSTLTLNLYGGLPLDVELQVTMWAYSAPKPLGNTIYKKYRIINRNSSRIDSTYLCMWSDPDLGNPYDDLAGCDSTIGLGYICNGKAYDEGYGNTPPAAGFVMLQSPYIPGVPSDTALVESRKLPGYKNLGMTGFFRTDDVSAGFTDPYGGYTTGALVLKNLFKITYTNNGLPVINPVTHKRTFYEFSGDPISNSGWLDILGNDKRMGLVSGPFTMNPGDTQEIFVAQVVAGGYKSIDNIQAVNMLKNYASSIKENWRGYTVPQPGVAPVVTASELDSKVILQWSDSSAYIKTEKDLTGGYKFEGYNIYRLPSATSDITNATRIATFDLADNYGTVTGWIEDHITGCLENRVIAWGTNSGIKRFIEISKDTLTNSGLINYSKYYFGVTSYYVTSNINTIPRVIESPLNIITIIPQPNAPGVRFSSSTGDTLATSFSGMGTVNLIPKVINPQSGTGKQYTLYFTKNSFGKFVWNLKNDSGILLTNRHVYPIDSTAVLSSDPVIDGVQMHVTGPQKKQLGNINLTSGSSPYWTNNYFFSYGGEFWNGTFCTGIHWLTGTSLDTAGNSCYHNIKIKFADTDSKGAFNSADANASIGYRFLRYAQNAAASSDFTPFIINHTNYGFQEFGRAGAPNIPVSVYDTDTGKRLALGFMENNVSGAAVNGYYWPPYNANNTVQREFLFILGEEYSTTPNAAYTGNNFNIYPNGKLPLMYFITSSRHDTTFSSSAVIDLYWNKEITANDKFTFTIPGAATSTELAKEDADKINVFPNPYYFYNPQESGAYERFVTFTHLPQKAIIKIFSIAGQLIKIIRKDDTGQIAKWDLTSDSGHKAASGIYVARIETPDLGKTKILKLAILQRR